MRERLCVVCGTIKDQVECASTDGFVAAGSHPGIAFASGWWRANDTLHSAGELKADEVDRIVAVIQNPRQFKIPVWGQGENAGPQQGFWMRGSSSCPWLCRFRFCVPA